MKKILTFLLTALMLVSTTVVSVSADELMYDFNGVSMGSPYELFDDEYKYGVLVDTTMYVANVPFAFRNDNARGIVNTDRGYYKRYTWSASSSEWVLYKSMSDKTLFDAYDGTYIVNFNNPDRADTEWVQWSTHNLRYYGTDEFLSSGDPNFMGVPLAIWVTTLAGGQMTKVAIPQIAEYLNLLVACGIGCLALLVTLPLLAKKLRMFL